MKKIFILAFFVALGLAVYAPTASALSHPVPPVVPVNSNPPAQPIQSAK